MGIGVVDGGRLKLVVVARGELTSPQWAQWRRAISKASELLFDATQGQVQIGDVYFADDSNGEDTADVILYPSGDPSFNSGRFGNTGAAVHVMPYVKEQVLTFLHEFGHHIWGLGEEYSQTPTSHPIDTSSPAPNRRTIPILASGLADDQLVDEGGKAILTIAGQLERHTVTANTSTSITVDTDFSVLPTDADSTTVWIQRPAECATAGGANFCIMENSRGAAGLLAPSGTWTPATDPVTEFCADSNHDPDGETNQEDRHNDSCWETIVTAPGFTTLTAPDPAAPGPATGSAPVDFFVLDPDPRFAIVLDRSGSMGDGTKLADAQHGAVYWVEFCAVSGDQLSVIWYDHAQLVLQPLTDVGALTDAQREQLFDDINALTPRGATGIRDALFEALDQLSTPPTRAATQVAVLLTDGIHNSPLFSFAQAAVPTLRENGVRVYALGVGEPYEVDMPTLDVIAAGTGGRSYAVGTSQPNEVETALVEINAEVRGGIIDSLPVTLPDAAPSDLDKQLRPLLSGKRARPSLQKLAAMLGVEIGSDGKVVGRDTGRVVSVRILVEERADRCSFTLLHPEGNPAWLYLLDPAGQPVDIGATGHTHVSSAAPHEFSILGEPAPGWWTLLVVRPQSGPSFQCHVVAGIENKRLRTFAIMQAGAEDGEHVELTAGARYGLPLTGLRVRARLVSPSGSVVSFALTDIDDLGDGTGTFRGSFLANEVGRYDGVVRIEPTTRARTAGALTRLLHLDGGDTLETTSDAPRFRRTIPVQVLVRKRGSGIDGDRREEGYVERGARRWKRPTKLRSAALPKRSRRSRAAGARDGARADSARE